MNDEHDKLGAKVKRTLESETSRLTLAPHIRRTVIATAEERRNAGAWAWLLDHRLAVAGAVCLIVSAAIVLHVSKPITPHHPEPYLQLRAEVRGGQRDRYWKKKSVEARTRNGEEGFIKIEATWPKQASVIALNTRRGR